MTTIRTVTIDCREIRDWDSFFDVFAEAFGFPDGYGRNLNAWIDMMFSLDDEHPMTEFKALPGEIVVLDLAHASELKRVAPDILTEIFEMSAGCNEGRIQAGYPPLLLVSGNTLS